MRLPLLALAALTLWCTPAHSGQDKYWVFFRDKDPAARLTAVSPPDRLNDSPIPDPAVPDVGARKGRSPSGFPSPTS